MRWFAYDSLESQLLIAAYYLLWSPVVSDFEGVIDLLFFFDGPCDVPFSHFRTPCVGKDEMAQRGQNLPKIANIFKNLLRRGQDVQET